MIIFHKGVIFIQMNSNLKMIRRSFGLLIVTLLLILASGIVVAADNPEEVEKQEVKLYFSDQQAQNLLAVVEEVEKDNLWSNVLEKLIVGPDVENVVMTVPGETKVISIQEEIVAEDSQKKRLIVNFSEELVTKHWGGSGVIITINSIINTLTQFEQVKEVKLLLEGKKLNYFGGLKINNPGSFNPEIIENENK